MNPFCYTRAADAERAIAAAASRPGTSYIAGGTTVLDLMKETVLAPDLLVDINALPFRGIEKRGDTMEIGALARMTDVADHAEVALHFPVVVEALRLSASAQLRNMASIGGNLLQRTRCAYYRDVATPCNKRVPGDGCSALRGENGRHAILGTSEHCISVHPSDLAVALVGLDATLVLVGRDGERRIGLDEFYLLPNDTPHVENVLQHGELIAAVLIPISAAGARSTYLKVRDRASFEFALVSVAAALDVQQGLVREARIALGGVAPKPWRAREAELELTGARATEETFRRVAETALRGARGYGQNDFKIQLAKNAIVRALLAVVDEA